MTISLLDLLSASNGTPMPRRTVVYGKHGIGKTTFACSCQDPVLLPFEDGYGTVHLRLKKSVPVLTFPDANGKKSRTIQSYDQAMEAIGFLATSDHSFKNVVVDGAELPDAECLNVVVELLVGIDIRSAALVNVDVFRVLTLAEDEELQERFAVFLRLVYQKILVNHVPEHRSVKCLVLLHFERFDG